MKKPYSVLEIICAEINRRGADGLVNTDAECGCDPREVNGCPCSQIGEECELARKKGFDELFYPIKRIRRPKVSPIFSQIPFEDRED